MRLSLALALTFTAASLAAQQQQSEIFKNPDALKESIKIEQKLGKDIPQGIEFKDAAGRLVRLSDFFGKGKPVVITPVYYDCPMLCNLVLDQLVNKMASLKLQPGRDFEIVTYSFNPKETTADAAEKKKIYTKRYGRPGINEAWHFLTGEQNSIAALSDSLGFRYAWDPIRNEYAHGAAIIVATADGKISRYFYGIEYSAKDLRLGLVESSEGKIGSATDKFLLMCYDYDPATGKYSKLAFNVVRLGGAVTILGIAGLIGILVRKDRAHRHE
jgi:protein SCO1/2